MQSEEVRDSVSATKEELSQCSKELPTTTEKDILVK